MKNILILLLLGLPFIGYSQDAPIKYGKLTAAEVALTKVDYDTSASAVVLCDYGRLIVTRSDGVIFRRHIRIKILDDNGLDKANVSIPYYHSSEKIISKNAQTINVVDGKPKRSSVGKKDFFKAKANENWSEIRFTFPEVNVGSVIEYAYSVQSENYTNLEPWVFQDDIPTLISYLNADIESNLRYDLMFQGPMLISKYGGNPSNTWILKDLPAIKDAPFCPNPFDYTEKIKFQLSAYFNGSNFIDVMTSWKSVAQDLYDGAGFRQFLNKNKDAKKIVSELVKPEDSDIIKTKKIYNYVISNYTWNKKHRMFTNEKYNDFKDKKIGNSSEINLFLVNLLQSADLEANIALVSTKYHGLTSRNITFYTQFNHLIANVKINNKDILIDATNRFRPYNLLDEQDLNVQAIVLDRDKPYWVDIVPYQKTRNIKMVIMEVPEPGQINYKIQLSARGYQAVDIREELDKGNKNLKKYFLDNIIKKDSDSEITNVEVKNIEVIDKPVQLSANIIDNSSSIVNDNFIYLSPFVDTDYDSNPFQEEKRYLPADFYYPFEKSYILNLKIPEGYDVVEFPQPVNIKLENDKGNLKYSASLKETELQIRIVFEINDPFFQPSEYAGLRELFDLYIEKRAEQIVLKKKA